MSIAVKNKVVYPHTKRASATKSQFLPNARYGVRVYLDNASSTPIDPKVQKEMARAGALYGNPSSFNNIGREARKELENSRLRVARHIGAKADEIIFTSSGSEANNLAVFGLAGTEIEKGEIITTPIEHLSILESLNMLKKKGWKITYLKVDRYGFVDPDDLKARLNSKVRLVSIIYANNEIGTIQPINKIAKVINDFRRSKLPAADSPTFFHIDACQATEYLEMNVNNLGVDLMTFNGAKIYGPKGIGVLYKKRGVGLKPIIYGGRQELGLRAGTENLPAIAGLAEALRVINKREALRVSKLRDLFLKEIRKILPEVRVNGPEGRGRLPNNINISVPDLASENLLLELDKYGICGSSGSACTTRSVEPSHVLEAIGVETHYLKGALRFSLGRHTSSKDVNYLLSVLPKIISNLRKRYKV